jgi:hypothetical protein
MKIVTQISGFMQDIALTIESKTLYSWRAFFFVFFLFKKNSMIFSFSIWQV